ncbi:hypothetical protein F5878DRAFT_111421 [Lentinula raphanica]|uniref:Uncharacterized protein n=1 Tax=Lentinula raphanica TaxID=153919 RepID=A0AA38PB06_9AGAR|nr:hypothetical protein F5878DRAFT_111421 [Lentinula raphanica]
MIMRRTSQCGMILLAFFRSQVFTVGLAYELAVYQFGTETPASTVTAWVLPLGTDSATRTTVLLEQLLQTNDVSTYLDAAAVTETVTVTSFVTNFATAVVSASGWRVYSPDYTPRLVQECHFTSNSSGECFIESMITGNSELFSTIATLATGLEAHALFFPITTTSFTSPIASSSPTTTGSSPTTTDSSPTTTGSSPATTGSSPTTTGSSPTSFLQAPSSSQTKTKKPASSIAGIAGGITAGLITIICVAVLLWHWRRRRLLRPLQLQRLSLQRLQGSNTSSETMSKSEPMSNSVHQYQYQAPTEFHRSRRDAYDHEEIVQGSSLLPALVPNRTHRPIHWQDTVVQPEWFSEDIITTETSGEPSHLGHSEIEESPAIQHLQHGMNEILLRLGQLEQVHSPPAYVS